MFSSQALTAKLAGFSVALLAHKLAERIEWMIGPGWVIQVHVQVNHR